MGFASRQPVDALPLPDPESLAHSARVTAAIGDAVAANGGWISFREFMRLALYAPGLGYYAAGARKLGPAGDFVTAPEMSPLFGYAIANSIADVFDAIGGGEILELGAGSGRLAIDVLQRLDALGVTAKYSILETSADLRERQRAAIAAIAPADRVRWLDRLSDEWTGVILGNEVLDAVPVEWVGRRDGVPFRRGVVTRDDGSLALDDRPLASADDESRGMREAIEQRFPEGDFLSEINPAAEALSATLASRLQRGLLLWIDYGFPAREYYHPQRSAGTLMCHYRHRAHDDPLLWPGLQDITAHVDFTAIARATCAAGVDLAGYTAQASFLVDCGIVDVLSDAGEPGSAGYLRATNAVQRLMSPAEMGELFKAIAFTRDVDIPIRGFRRGDRSGRL